MFDTLTPNIDTSRTCDDMVCAFSLANVSDHSNCDISWSGDAATNADLDIDKSPARVEIDPMFVFQNGQPLTITLSCPSQ
jgi:hypothetical protein